MLLSYITQFQNSNNILVKVDLIGLVLSSLIGLLVFFLTDQFFFYSPAQSSQVCGAAACIVVVCAERVYLHSR